MMDNAEPAAWTARKLLRAARVATLATVSDGQPFASLVTPATAPDASVLLLLSDLSEHTRHLRADPRCSLLVVGHAAEANPQTAPRLSLTALASLEPDPSMLGRFVAIHPYAAVYAGFGDFHLWRLRPGGGLLVAGFGRANRLRQADLVAPPWSAAEKGCVAADADGADLRAGDRTERRHWPEPLRMADALQQHVTSLVETSNG